MAPPRKRIGIHLSTSGGTWTAVQRAVDCGANCFQIFSSSPRTWHPTPVTAEDAEKMRTLRADFNITPLTIHASYLINLCSQSETVRQNSTAAFRGEVERALESCPGLLGRLDCLLCGADGNSRPLLKIREWLGHSGNVHGHIDLRPGRIVFSTTDKELAFFGEEWFEVLTNVALPTSRQSLKINTTLTPSRSSHGYSCSATR